VNGYLRWDWFFAIIKHTKDTNCVIEWCILYITFVQAIKAGIVWINCAQPSFIQAPWGGIKRSGFGRELGEWYVPYFLNQQMWKLVLVLFKCEKPTQNAHIITYSLKLFSIHFLCQLDFAWITLVVNRTCQMGNESCIFSVLLMRISQIEILIRLFYHLRIWFYNFFIIISGV